MKQYFLALTLLLVCVDAQTKYCCMSDQWEGLLASYVGVAQQPQPVFSMVRTMMYFDYSNKRSASFTNVSSTTGGTRLLVLKLYNEKVSYTMDLSSRKCQKESLSQTMQKACVPDNASPYGQPYYYGAGTEKLKAQRYIMNVPHQQMSVVLSVEPNQCIPITEVLFGMTAATKPEGIMQAIEFSNVTPNITNPDVFKMPPECQQAVVGPTKEVPHISPWFLSL